VGWSRASVHRAVAGRHAAGPEVMSVLSDLWLWYQRFKICPQAPAQFWFRTGTSNICSCTSFGGAFG